MEKALVLLTVEPMMERKIIERLREYPLMHACVAIAFYAMKLAGLAIDAHEEENECKVIEKTT